MLSYKIVVEDSSSEIVTHFFVSLHSTEISDLLRNREYSFKIVVTNAVGNVSSSDRQFCKFNCVTFCLNYTIAMSMS